MIFKPFLEQKIKELSGNATTDSGDNNGISKHTILRDILFVALYPFNTPAKAATTCLVITITTYLWSIRSPEPAFLLQSLKDPKEHKEQDNQRVQQLKLYHPDTPYSVNTTEGKRAEEIIVKHLQLLPNWQSVNHKNAIKNAPAKISIEKVHIGGPEYSVELDERGGENKPLTKWTELWKVSNSDKTQELEFTITFNPSPPQIKEP